MDAGAHPMLAVGVKSTVLGSLEDCTATAPSRLARVPVLPHGISWQAPRARRMASLFFDSGCHGVGRWQRTPPVQTTFPFICISSYMVAIGRLAHRSTNMGSRPRVSPLRSSSKLVTQLHFSRDRHVDWMNWWVGG